MAWVKLDDHFPDHVKLAQCDVFAPLCGWLYVCGLAYCNRQLTDGAIPKGHIHRLVNFRGVQVVTGGVGTGTDTLAQFTDDIDVQELARWLVSVGLWEETDADYIIHDYLDYQPSRADVLATRDKTASRVRSWREQSERNANRNGVTNAATNGKRNGVSTRAPVPVPVPDPQDQKIHTPRYVPAQQHAETSRQSLTVYGDDLWDAWREAAARHGHDRIPATPSGARWSEHMRAIVGIIRDRAELDAALECWWASPHVTIARVVGAFAADLPEVLAHLQAGHAHAFRDPKPPVVEESTEVWAAKAAARVVAQLQARS